MFSTNSLVAATAAFSLIASSTALYDANAKTNVAMYWGNGAGQLPLLNFCESSSADIIPVGFVNTYPSAANGLVEENFGNACWGEEYRYEGPGYNGKPPVPGQNLLPTFCPAVQDGIPKCQAMGKKIILSIGGAAPVWNPKTGMVDKTYKGQLKTKEDGEYLATFLWKAYGPYDPSYTGVRPLDRGGDNQTESIKIHIDGFDFDIEDTINGSNKNEGETLAYIACINKLRTYMDAETAKTGKKYMITGAPQCTLNPGDHNMDAMIYNAKFDALFVQFYNQGPASCTARSRANGVGGFNFDAWASYLNRAGSASAGAKIYIGLLGGPTGSAFAPGDYLNTPEVQNLIATYGKKSQLGGVMLWDATAAQVNVDNTLPANKKYWDVVKDALLKNYPPVSSTTSKTTTTSSKTTTTSSKTTTTSSKTTTTSSKTTTTSSKTTTTSSKTTTTSSKTTTTSSKSSSLTTTSSIPTTSSSSATPSESSSAVYSTTSEATTSSSAVSSSSSSESTTSTTTSEQPSSSSTTSEQTSSSSTTSEQPSSSSTTSEQPTSSSTTSEQPSTSSSATSTTTSESSTTTTSASYSESSTSDSSYSTTSASSSESSTSDSSYSTTSASSSESSSATTSSASYSESSSSVSQSESSSSATSSASHSETTSSASYSESSSSATTTSASSSETSSSSSAASTSTHEGTTTSHSTSSESSTSSTYPTTKPYGNSTTTSYRSSTTSKSSTVSHGGSTTAPPHSSSATTTKGGPMTTSTVYTTQIETITSCAPTVTDCPLGHVTTKTIPLYTTVCPVSETTKAPHPTTSHGGELTTSTVYTTIIGTVTACPPTVTDCPLGQVTTKTVALYTTVCPVSEATGKPSYVPTIKLPAPVSSAVGVPEGGDSTTTLQSTFTTYRTVTAASESDIVAPYPTGRASGGGRVLGTGAPSVIKPTTVPEGTKTSEPVATFTGAATSLKGGMSVVAAFVVGVVAIMI